MPRQTVNLLALAALAACACANPSSRSATMDTTRDENRRTIEKLFETSFNQGDLGLIDELVGPEYVAPPPRGGTGPAAFKAIIVGLRNAFPDIHYTLDETVAENDKVAVRWHWTGTHKAAFRTYPATGKAMTNTGMGVFQLRAGKIVAATLETDRLGFLQQVGAVPADVGAPPSRPPAPQAAAQ
jgi:steroid delta-isomerase-like uncharacterized protein